MCARCFGYDLEPFDRVVGDPAGADFLPTHASSQGGGRGDNPGISGVAATGIAAVDALLQGNGWSGGTLTFSFPTDSAQYTDYIYYGANELPTFSPLSLEFREAIRQILGGGTLEGGAATFGFGSVASMTNMTFNEVAAGAGDMRFAFSDEPNVAWGYYPWGSGGEGGDAWFNSGYMGLFATPVPGSYTWATAVHEIGHTLGLKHGHEVGGIINAAVPTEMDSLEFTIMTYRSYVGDDTNGYNNEQFGFPQTFMMLDIRALQQLYGADFTVNSGDTTYTWDETTGEMSLNGVAQGAPGANRVFLTVWDGNGEDTYDLSNYANGARIDLTPGGYSVTDAAQLANLGNGNFARGNVFNALQYNADARSLIENAIGGAGDDTIIGNIIANDLQGGAGRDLITGGGGNDVIDGGGGVDRINGGGGADNLNGGGGNDLLVYANSNAGVTVRLWNNTATGGHATGDTIFSFERVQGSAHADTLIGSVGDNSLYGVNGDDFLGGLEGDDFLDGGAGDDRVNGGLGADTLIGGLGEDVLQYSGSHARVIVRLWNDTAIGGHATGDTISGFEHVLGSDHDDVLVGSDGENVLAGAKGDDQLHGGAGDDVLEGGVGGDVLAGGAGADTASYFESNARVIVRLYNGTTSGGHATGDTLTDIENLIGSNHNDVLAGSAVSNELTGGAGDDYLDGQGGADLIEAGTGDDRVLGGAGADVMYGDLGSDTLLYTGSNAGVTVRLWNNTASGGHAAGDMFAGFENVSGSSHGDTLIGSTGVNTLDGAAGDDNLHGGRGADTIIGGAGDDQLAGGDDNDLFVFVGASGADTVLDFDAGVGAGDVIRLDSTIFADFADVLIHTNDDGLGRTVISKNGVTITLEGVLKAQLAPDDFAFAAPGAPAAGEAEAGAPVLAGLMPGQDLKELPGGVSGDLAWSDARVAPEVLEDKDAPVWFDALVAPEPPGLSLGGGWAAAAPEFDRPLHRLVTVDHDWIW